MRVAKEEPSSSLADTVESSPAPRKGSAAVAGLLDRPAVLAAFRAADAAAAGTSFPWQS